MDVREMKGSHGTAILTFFLFSVGSVVLVHGQSTSGNFISVDCGKSKGYIYNDSDTGIQYTSDFDYVDTGKIDKVASNFQSSDYIMQYLDLRSFPNGTRNCFTIKPSIVKGKKYLVRSLFMYGNYDGLNRSHMQFDLYLGVNLWATISLTEASSMNYYEIMTMATSDSLSVCLVDTGYGPPFISAIEIRPLEDIMYDRVLTTYVLPHLLRRIDVGSNEPDRYPLDNYDRQWTTVDRTDWKSVSTAETVVLDKTNDVFKPPSIVMQTAAIPASEERLDFNGTFLLSSLNSSRYQVIMYFAEVQKLSLNESRIFNITVNGDPLFNLFKPAYLRASTLSTLEAKSYNKLEISILKVAESTLPPILNAIEIYQVDDNSFETDSQDVDAIGKIKASYKVQKNWMGDPCLPKSFIWDGINCSYEDYPRPKIISLNLSFSALTGQIPAYIANITELRHLDMSGNNLTGTIPSSLATLSGLSFLNLKDNNLNGSIPDELLNRAAAGTLILMVDEGYSNSTENKGSSNSSNSTKKKGSSKVVIVVVSSIGCIVALATLVVVVLIILRRLRSNQGNNSPLPTQLYSEHRLFSYSELVTITNNFERVIGRGGSGVVYHGFLIDHMPVAVKVLSKPSSQGLEEFETEAQLLTRVHHRNLLSLIGYCHEPNHLALIYECMAGGSLKDHLSGKDHKSVLTWKARLHIAKEAAQGLEYLHKSCRPPIVHRDIKTNNILLSENLETRIADLGLSKIFQCDGATHASTTKIVGTRGYVDPEYYNSYKLTEKSDVYSFGIVLLELVTGLPTFLEEGDSMVHVLQFVKSKVAEGGISVIIDEKLHGIYDTESAEKVVETAFLCTLFSSVERQDMTVVLSSLKNCLELDVSQGDSEISSNANLDNCRNNHAEVCKLQMIKLPDLLNKCYALNPFMCLIF